VADPTGCCLGLEKLRVRIPPMLSPTRINLLRFREKIDDRLDGFSSTYVILMTALCIYALSFILSIRERVGTREVGGRSRNALLEYIQRLPFVSHYIRHLRRKVVAELSQTTQQKHGTVNKRPCLPLDGTSTGVILAQCSRMRASDSKNTNKMSGAIYVEPDSAIFELCSTAYNMFAHTNPLHGDSFPSVTSMEADIVNFTASFLGSDEHSEICGNLTSGGTESILSALRTSRDFMRSKRGILQPEMYVDNNTEKCALNSNLGSWRRQHTPLFTRQPNISI